MPAGGRWTGHKARISLYERPEALEISSSLIPSLFISDATFLHSPLLGGVHDVQIISFAYHISFVFNAFLPVKAGYLTGTEQAPLPRRLHLHDEMPAALALAPQVKTYRLVCRCEARDLRPGEGQAQDMAALGKDGVEEADDDVTVGLVAEHRLEARVREDVDIPLKRAVSFLHIAHITQIFMGRR